MTAAEALALTRWMRAACPQQKFDEYTADAWFDLMSDLDFADAKTAATAIARRQPFVSPAEIRAEIKRTTTVRLQNVDEQIPDADPDDVPAYLEALRQRRLRPTAELPARPVQQLLEGNFK